MGSKGDTIQRMTLLHVLGPDAIDVYNTWTEDKTRLADIKKKFKEYCNPSKNERHGFNTRTRKVWEPVDALSQHLEWNPWKISKVETPTSWVSPIVVVKKPSGKVGLCLDLKILNNDIKRTLPSTRHLYFRLCYNLSVQLKWAN